MLTANQAECSLLITQKQQKIYSFSWQHNDAQASPPFEKMHRCGKTQVKNLSKVIDSDTI